MYLGYPQLNRKTKILLFIHYDSFPLSFGFCNDQFTKRMGIHGSIAGKTMMRLCFDHTTTATAPLPNL